MLIKKNSDDGKDRLLWKWLEGDATDPADFGDPVTSTGYALCVYTGTVRVQLVNQNAKCWEATYSGTPIRNDESQFKAKGD